MNHMVEQLNGYEVYHLDEDGEIVPNAVFAKDEIVLLAEKNGDSWCIEPSLEREPQDAPASNNVQVDLEDALEMSEKTTSNVFAGRKLLFGSCTLITAICQSTWQRNIQMCKFPISHCLIGTSAKKKSEPVF